MSSKPPRMVLPKPSGAAAKSSAAPQRAGRAQQPQQRHAAPAPPRSARGPAKSLGGMLGEVPRAAAPQSAREAREDDEVAGAEGNVRVVARFRPMNEREKKENRGGDKAVSFVGPDEVEIDGSPKYANTANGEPLKFRFHAALAPTTAQEEVFHACCESVMVDLFQGYHSTIFAYGQTGAGKSFTMMGDRSSLTMAGLIPRCTAAMFSAIGGREGVEFVISCSYLQVYMEVISDLLSPEKNNLQIRESTTRGIYVEHLSTEYVASVGDVYALLDLGDANRKVGATNMNATSSRSHSCFVFNITQKDEEGATTHSRFNLVDLAGSERVGKTGAQGLTLEEAKKINLSLSCLSQCINALAIGGSQHVPFRSSKLTRLLQQSLGGNCKTTVLVACSPHESNLDETISTLRFGERCSAVKCEAKANVTLSVEQLQELVTSLQDQLQRAESRGLEAQQKLRGGVTVKCQGIQFPEEEDEEGSDGEGEEERPPLSESALAVPVRRRQRKVSRAVPAGAARVAACVQLKDFDVEEFGEEQQAAFKDAVCEVLTHDVPALAAAMDPSKVDIVDVQPGMQVAFGVSVEQSVAVEAATSLNVAIGFGSNGAFVKALSKRGFNLPNLSAPELVSNVTTRFSAVSKGERVSEIDMLYTSVMEKQLEVEALKAEMAALKGKLDSVKDIADRKQTHIDALSTRLTSLNERLLKDKGEQGTGSTGLRRGSAMLGFRRRASEIPNNPRRPVSLEESPRALPKVPAFSKKASSPANAFARRRSRADGARRKASIPHFFPPSALQRVVPQQAINEEEEEDDESDKEEDKGEAKEEAKEEAKGEVGEEAKEEGKDENKGEKDDEGDDKEDKKGTEGNDDDEGSSESDDGTPAGGSSELGVPGERRGDKRLSLRLSLPKEDEHNRRSEGDEDDGNVGDLEEANEELRMELDEMQGIVEDLESQVDEQQDIIARQTQSLDKLEEERRERELDLQEMVSQKDTLQKHVSELELEVARLQKQHHAARPAHNIQKPIQTESVLRDRKPEEDGGVLASLIPDFGGLFGSGSGSGAKEKGGLFGLF